MVVSTLPRLHYYGHLGILPLQWLALIAVMVDSCDGIVSRIDDTVCSLFEVGLLEIGVL